MSYYRHYPTFAYYILLALTTAHAVQLVGSSQLQHNTQKNLDWGSDSKKGPIKRSCFILPKQSCHLRVFYY